MVISGSSDHKTFLLMWLDDYEFSLSLSQKYVL